MKPNTKYTISQKDYNDIINDQIFIHQYDKNKNNILWNEGLTYRGVRENLTFTTDSNAYYLRFRTEDNRELNPNTIMIEEGSIATPIVSSQSAKKEISLLEPLRGTNDNAKDRIVKKNGQWVIERNCGEVILNGSEDWSISSISSWKKQVYYTDYPNALDINNPIIPHTKNNRLKDVSPNNLVNKNEYGISLWILDGTPCFLMDVENISNLNELKQWLSKNPVTIVYPLGSTVYEPLNIDSVVNTYLDITHMSNSSNIPANMKVTIDRTINRATDAIELAKSNPTMENLSRARMWANLLKESTNKDSLQNKINNITDIEDLQLERKTATSNIDVYIKSENMLLMSLSTNSITFNDFSGVNDMELNNAVNISINSSLPYQLHSYLLSEIENSDKSNRIEKDLLNIKINDDTDYKIFDDINEKLILENDCNAGNNKSHSIDLKLKGGDAHKADVYKTVIKFEAEQK